MSTNDDRIDDADREERIQVLKEQARQAAGGK
jgi:hypothetical protein